MNTSFFTTRRIVLIGIGLLLLITMFSGCSKYGTLVNKQEATDGQWSQVESAYQRRTDLIGQLVAVVQSAAQFERVTLTEVISARKYVSDIKLDPSTATEEDYAKFEKAQSGMMGALSRLMVAVEQYPELKSQARFGDLMVSIEGSENRISTERQRFIELAKDYNTYRRQPVMPALLSTTLFASTFPARKYFEAAEGAEKPAEINMMPQK